MVTENLLIRGEDFKLLQNLITFIEVWVDTPDEWAIDLCFIDNLNF